MQFEWMERLARLEMERDAALADLANLRRPNLAAVKPPATQAVLEEQREEFQNELLTLRTDLSHERSKRLQETASLRKRYDAIISDMETATDQRQSEHLEEIQSLQGTISDLKSQALDGNEQVNSLRQRYDAMIMEKEAAAKEQQVSLKSLPRSHHELGGPTIPPSSAHPLNRRRNSCERSKRCGK